MAPVSKEITLKIGPMVLLKFLSFNFQIKLTHGVQRYDYKHVCITENFLKRNLKVGWWDGGSWSSKYVVMRIFKKCYLKMKEK